MTSREPGVDETVAGIVGVLGAVIQAKYETDPALAKYSDWLPAPPPDPDFLRRLRRVRWEKGVAAVAMVGACAGFTWLFFWNLHVNPLLIIQAVIGSWGAVWLRAKSWRAAPHVSDLLDLPATFPQFPVELKYKILGCSYGADEGVLSFVDGWMHFQGRRTSWSLCAPGANAIGVQAVSSCAQASSTTPVTKIITWRRLGRSYQIEVLPMDRLEGLGAGLQRKFSLELDAWNRTARRCKGAPIFPPVQAVPGLVERLERAVRLSRTVNLLAGGAFAGALIVGVALGEIAIWPLYASAVVLLLALIYRAAIAYRLANVARAPMLSATMAYRGPAGWIPKLAYRLKSYRYRRSPRWFSLTADHPADSVPVEIRYDINRVEYRVETGWLSSRQGWLQFWSLAGGWTLPMTELKHRDPSEEHWRSFFEAPLPLEQFLGATNANQELLMKVFPLDPLSGSALRLAAMVTKSAASETATAEEAWPPVMPEPGRIRRMQWRRMVYTGLLRLSFCASFGAIVAIFANFDAYGLAGILTLLSAVFVALFAAIRRSILTDRLTKIYYLCEGGRSDMRFRPPEPQGGRTPRRVMSRRP